MKYYAGPHVSMNETTVSIVDERRKVVKGRQPETIAA
jgi:hypothetical protein